MTIVLDRRIKPIAALLAAAGALALLVAAPAQAQSNTAAVCSVTFPDVSITPPFYPFVLSAAPGTVSTNGQTGTVTCIGELDGSHVTGPGTAGLTYAYTGSCIAHTGLGTVTWSVPTAAGVKHMTGTLSVRRVAVGILAEARFPDAHARHRLLHRTGTGTRRAGAMRTLGAVQARWLPPRRDRTRRSPRRARAHEDQ